MFENLFDAFWVAKRHICVLPKNHLDVYYPVMMINNPLLIRFAILSSNTRVPWVDRYCVWRACVILLRYSETTLRWLSAAYQVFSNWNSWWLEILRFDFNVLDNILAPFKRKDRFWVLGLWYEYNYPLYCCIMAVLVVSLSIFSED